MPAIGIHINLTHATDVVKTNATGRHGIPGASPLHASLHL